MSAERAEFIFDGDATKVVSELYRIKEAVSVADKALRKAAKDPLADLQTLAGELVKQKTLHTSLTQAINATGEAQKKTAKEGATVTRESNYVVRNSFTQMSYVVNDFLSVSGGLQERVRAIANNIQYMAVSIPGPWGVAINVLTMAAQVATALSVSFSRSKESINEQLGAVKDLISHHEKLTDAIYKVMKGQSAFDEMTRRREHVRATAPIMAEIETQEAVKAKLLKDIENLTASGLGAGPQIARVKAIGPELENLRGELQRVNVAFARREALVKREEGEDRASRSIEDLKKGLEEVFLRTVADPAKRAGVGKEIEGRVAGLLPRELQFTAEKVAKQFVDEFWGNLQQKQMVNAAKVRTPLAAAVEAKEGEIEQAQQRLDAAEAAARLRAGGGKISPLDKRDIQILRDFVDALRDGHRVLKAEFGKENKAQNAALMQVPIPPRPVPINRNGNR